MNCSTGAAASERAKSLLNQESGKTGVNWNLSPSKRPLSLSFRLGITGDGGGDRAALKAEAANERDGRGGVVVTINDGDFEDICVSGRSADRVGDELAIEGSDNVCLRFAIGDADDEIFRTLGSGVE